MTKTVIGITTWIAILFIAFGLILDYVHNNFTTWFFFVFFCLIGIATAAWDYKKK